MPSGRTAWMLPLDGLTKYQRYRLKKLARGLCQTCTREREDKTKGHCNSCLKKFRANWRTRAHSTPSSGALP